MSRIAAMLALWAAPPVTAEQAMAAYAAATSIGRDPCRGVGADEGEDAEIVVCARRTNVYAVPLYRADTERYDSPGTAAGGVAAVADASAPCHARGEACLRPLPVVTVPIGPKPGRARIGD